MKKLFFFPVAFLLFSFHLFALDNFDVFAQTNTGTVLIDQDIETYNIDGGAGVRVGEENFDFSILGTAGRVYGDKRISYAAGTANFSYSFTDNFSASLNLFAAGGHSQVFDLFIFFGSIDLPFGGGASLKLSFPLNFYLDTGLYGGNYNILSDQDKPIGGGKINLFDVAAGKKWIFPAKAGNSIHQIDANAGFLYSYANGNLTLTIAEQRQMLMPFSYAYGDTDACLEFITMQAKYSYSYNNLDLEFNSALYLNFYAYLRYYFKGTYKKNLFYDGSVTKNEDTITLSNGDSLLAMDAKASYSLHFTDSLTARVFLEDRKSVV